MQTIFTSMGLCALALSIGAQADPRSEAAMILTPAPGELARSLCPAGDSGPSAAIRVVTEKWRRAGFHHPQITILDPKDFCTLPPSVHYSHQLKLTAVILRGAGWEVAEVEDRLRRVSEIYAQCGVRVTGATVALIDPLQGSPDIANDRTDKGGISYALAQATPRTDRPVIYYVRSRADGGTANAHPEFSVAADSPMVNTAWITTAVKGREYRYLRDPAYLPDAHELGHLLTNFGHVSGLEPNLMSSDFNRTTDQLTDSQCETIRNSDLVEPIGVESATS